MGVLLLYSYVAATLGHSWLPLATCLRVSKLGVWLLPLGSWKRVWLLLACPATCPATLALRALT